MTLIISAHNPNSDNQQVTAEEMLAIRTMSDFDLTMLISEIHDHGWRVARKLIPLIQQSEQQRRGDH